MVTNTTRAEDDSRNLGLTLKLKRTSLPILGDHLVTFGMDARYNVREDDRTQTSGSVPVPLGASARSKARERELAL